MDSDFRVGAAVECRDGAAGTLRQLVVDPATDSVTHLVVESREHFGIPLLVPLHHVAAAETDVVRLNCTQAEFNQMDPFEQVMSSGVEGQSGVPGLTAPTFFPAPGLGGTAMEGLVPPFRPSAPMMPMVEEVVPQGEVVIGRHSAVHATDGEVGHVEDLVTDPATGQLTHLVVRSGHFWATHTFRLPASAVEAVEEDTVRLRLTQEDVEAIAREAAAAKEEDRRA